MAALHNHQWIREALPDQLRQPPTFFTDRTAVHLAAAASLRDTQLQKKLAKEAAACKKAEEAQLTALLVLGDPELEGEVDGISAKQADEGEVDGIGVNQVDEADPSMILELVPEPDANTSEAFLDMSANETNGNVTMTEEVDTTATSAT